MMKELRVAICSSHIAGTFKNQTKYKLHMPCVRIWPATWGAKKLDRRGSLDEKSAINIEKKENQL